LVTGVENDFWVLEGDTPDGHAHDGIASLRQLEQEHGALPDTLMAMSPSGSVHRYFQIPTDGRTVRNSASKLAPGVDVRGDGGMVIAPPSVKPGKGVYRWLNLGTPIAAAPEWLLEKVCAEPQEDQQPYNPEAVSDERRAAYGQAALRNIVERIKELKVGQRSNEITRESFRIGRLVAGGCLDIKEAEAALIAAAQALGLPRRDKAFGPRGTIARQLRAGLSSPRGPGDNQDDLPVDIDEFLKTHMLPPVVVDEQQEEEQEPSSSSPPPPPPPLPPPPIDDQIPNELLKVPGLVGEIAQFILDSALYPQPLMALAAGLGVVATACGRYLLGPTKSGTTVYIICLAETGTGKDHAQKLMVDILKAAGMSQHNGPEQFMSMPSLINFLKPQPLSLCVQDEFGSYLKRINSKRASGFEATLMAIMQKVWSSCSRTFITPEWAQTRSEQIAAPCMNVVGFSTMEQFFEALQSKEVVNGFLNRILVFETLLRVSQQKPKVDSMDIPDSITKRLRDIYEQRGGAMSFMSNVVPDFVYMGITPEAEEARLAYVRELEKIDDQLTRNLMVRSPEIAVRLATIVSMGLWQNTIEVDDMQWAINFARWVGMRLVTLAKQHIADSENQDLANKIMKIVRKRGRGKECMIKQSEIVFELRHRPKVRDILEVIGGFLVSAELVIAKIEKPQRGGRSTYSYKLGPNGK